ncbi:MAG: DUF4350 domain-containing protein [Acidimicrobiia bacterium]|nr:DUF4350 domain-containing protein [Acidimicrobiia bacterium]
MSGSGDTTGGFRSWPLAGRVAAVAVVVVLGLNLLAWTLERVAGGSGPGGERSSSFGTGDDGVAAYASLLEGYGVSVSEQRGALGDAPLDPAATLLVLDPGGLTGDDLEALKDFVDGGGALVVGGVGSDTILEGLMADPPAFSDGGPRRFSTLGADPLFDDVDDVRTDGAGSWSEPGSAEPLVGAGDRDLVERTTVGSGEVIALADVSPLQNRLLAQGDNALFGLALTGGQTEVVFAEGVHGADETRGIRAIPTSWKIALGGLVLAAALAMWTKGRRLGPPELPQRRLAPPRAAYVDALATTLARTSRRDEALAPLRDAARERLSRRTGLGPDPDPAALRRAARRLGWADDEIEAVCAPDGPPVDHTAVARALARMERTVTAS